MGGSLAEHELDTLLDRCKPYLLYKPTAFIETGTYKGDTAKVAARLFARVYTIEINKDLWKDVQGCFLTFPNIQSFHGDSVKTLPEIMAKEHGPCMWFLDAHQSGNDTSNNGKWVPLFDEMDAIFRVPVSGIVVVDDVRLFSKHWDWEGISVKSIVNRLKTYGLSILKHFIHNDRLVVVVYKRT